MLDVEEVLEARRYAGRYHRQKSMWGAIDFASVDRKFIQRKAKINRDHKSDKTVSLEMRVELR